MTKTKIFLVPAIAGGLLLALTGCVPYVSAGPRVTDDREIDAVDSVLLETGGDLGIVLGDEPSLTISAPQGAMDRLTSKVEGGVLVLGSKGPHFGWWNDEIRYTLTVPSISEVAIVGSGDVNADFSGADSVRVSIEGSGDIDGYGVDADEVTITIEGSGGIELVGTTDEQSIEISGSGEVGNEDLESRDARVRIEGSGDVEVNATRTLDAEISGAGEIRYRGGAEVTSEISGSGNVVED